MSRYYKLDGHEVVACDLDQWRYSTWGEAEAGHARAVAIALAPRDSDEN